MADSKEKLFSDFSPVSTEQWMEKVTADLISRRSSFGRQTKDLR